MSDLNPALPARLGGWRDYLEMCKPKVVLLMLLCATIGMHLATPGLVPLKLLFFANLGIALVAGSAAALNHLVDMQLDARMARTEARPLAQGKVQPREAMLFIAVTGTAGLMVLLFLVNPLTAWLNLASWVGYGLLYSIYLKWATPQNIVIGGLFGAAPPLFGWTAVTNSIDAGGLLLMLIIFVWTPPHFWALAIDRRAEYARAEVPMLPVTHGHRYTRLQILLYTLALFAVSLLPFVIRMSGLLYLLVAVSLGCGFLYWAVALMREKDERAPMETFKYSVAYLAALFIGLLVDHYTLTPEDFLR